jgi:peptide deformylase
MSVLKILTEGDKKLAQVCGEVKEFNKKLHQLLDDMKETMYESGGVGLAAPQIGELLRVVVVDIGNDYFELINPKIIESKGKQYGPEGCLSCPGKTGITVRPKFVKVSAVDRSGKEIEVTGEKLKSRTICHEIDHLDGILFKARLVKFSNFGLGKIFQKNI